jgi:TusA-related sulfurtransferase
MCRLTERYFGNHYNNMTKNPKDERRSFEMPEEIKVDKVMDLKGLPCPMPIVKVSKGIKEIEVGQVVEAITTDPGSITDFPTWAKTSGNEILKTEQDGEAITFYIKRLM